MLRILLPKLLGCVHINSPVFSSILWASLGKWHCCAIYIGTLLSSFYHWNVLDSIAAIVFRQKCERIKNYYRPLVSLLFWFSEWRRQNQVLCTAAKVLQCGVLAFSIPASRAPFQDMPFHSPLLGLLSPPPPSQQPISFPWPLGMLK